MNKRIRKKHFTQKRNAVRKFILSMDEGIDRDRMLMLHAIRFGDDKFFREVIGIDYFNCVIENGGLKKEYKS